MSEEEGTEHRYQLTRGRQNHIETEVSGGIRLGFRLYAPDDAEYQRNQRAYVQYDLPSPFGVLRGRNIRIVLRRVDNEPVVRWPQFPTGRRRPSGSDGELKPELLDVIGPRTAEGRTSWAEVILSVYRQIVAEAEAGTLPTRQRRQSS